MNPDDNVFLGRPFEETPESKEFRLAFKNRKEREEKKYKEQRGSNGILRIIEGIVQETVNNRFNRLRNKVNNKNNNL